MLSRWRRLVRKWLSSSPRPAARPKAARKPSCRLQVEPLEVRLTPATHTWVGGTGVNGNLWSVPANWSENAAPTEAGATLVFGQAGAIHLADNTNDLAAASIGSITFNAGGYTIGGKAITLTGDVADTVNGTDALNLDTTLAAGTKTFSVAAGATLSLGGSLTGAGGLTKQGSGTLGVSGADTYSGDTTVAAGTLLVKSPGSLLAAGNVIVDAGATLAGDGSVGNVRTLGGTVTPRAAGGTKATLSATSADFSLGGNLTVFVKDYPTPGTDYSNLKASGSVTLGSAATLTLDLTGLSTTGTTLGDGIIASGGLTGGFASVSLVNNPNHFRAKLLPGPTNLQVEIDPDFPLTANGETVTPPPTEQASFTGEVATFTDADPNPQLGDFTATIAWGDGQTSAGVIGYDGFRKVFTVSGTHTYADEGPETIHVTIQDGPGNTATADSTANVADAALTGSSGATAGGGVEGVTAAVLAGATFTDANAAAPAGDFTVTAAAWGDGSTSTAGLTVSANGGGSFTVSGSHLYAEDGPHNFSLTVTDTVGTTATITGSATVADAPLTDTSTAPATQPSAAEGASTGALTVATFTDANPGDNHADFTATIHWGDGNDSPGTVTFNAGTYSVGGSHTYAEEKAGGYAVTVDVADTGGSKLTGIGKTVVTATDAALTGSSGATAAGGVEGVTAAVLAGATFTDANTAAPAGDFTVTAAAWGDGSHSTAGLTVSGSGGSYAVSGSHLYAEDGTYSFSFTVKDTGGSTATITGSATVADAALTSTGAAQILTATEQASTGAVTVASFSDPGTDGTNDYKATIDWGDGQSSTGTVTPAGGTNFNVTGSHAYAEEGTYAVKVSIADKASTVVAQTTFFQVADAVLTSTGAAQTLTATEQASTGTVTVASFSDLGTDGTTADYTASIDWGDGTSSTGTVALAGGTKFNVTGGHTYAEEGPYKVTVTVKDKGGSSVVATNTAFQVADAALTSTGAAQVLAATEQAGTGPQVVASFSDPGTDGTAADYKATIDWGDGQASAGTVSPTGGTGFNVTGSHAYAEEGPYAVTVTITDAGGAPALVAKNTAFLVADAALTSTGATQTLTATEQASTGTVTVASFSDPGTDGTAADYTATIAWGDGQSSTGTVNPVAGTTTFNVTGGHTYAEEGPYKVTVTVKDKGGSSVVATNTAFQVADAALTANGAATQTAVEQAGTGTVTVASFSDPGTDGTTGDYTALILWGDGQASTGTVTAGAGNKFNVAGSHAYAEEGAYAVTVTITDAGGAPALVAKNTAFQVADALITSTGALQSLAATEQANTGSRVVATFSDPGSDGTVNDYTATIDWGDGQTSAGTVALVGNTAFGVSGNHTYAEEGTYGVTVTVKDKGGNTATAVNTSFQVADAALTSTGPVQTLPAVERADTGPVTVASFSDPGTDGTANDYAATILWGDGTSSPGTVTPGGGGFAVTGAHTYAEEGGYSVSVLITDKGGSRLVALNTSFQVADAALTKVGAPIALTSVEGSSTGTKMVAAFSDPGTDGTAGDYTATVLWADGQTSTGTVTPAGGNVFAVTASHVYAEESTFIPGGVYNFHVIIKDTAGQSITITDGTVKVVDAPFTIAESRIIVVNGLSIQGGLLGTFSDPGGLGKTAQNYTVMVKWDDGTSSTTGDNGANGTVTIQLDPTGSLYRIIGNHTYAKAGTYDICVEVADEHGQIFRTAPVLGGFRATLALIGNANALFNDRLFQTLTGQKPQAADEASAPFKGALAQTDPDQLKAAQKVLVQQVQSDPRTLMLKVINAYQGLLERDPETAALNNWVHFLAQGGSEEQMRALLIGSDEFFQHNGLKLGLGDALDQYLFNIYYTKVNKTQRFGLGRTLDSRFLNPDGTLRADHVANPDFRAFFQQFQAETRGWKQMLMSGAPRSEVALFLLQSVEGRRNTVNNMYLTFLGRDARNDPALDGWVAFMDQGHTESEVEANIILSGEFYNNLSTGNDIPCTTP